ncbi:alginate export family protein [Saliniradius amylolyticus]|uniref:alginate export family protein n=1 Tax=Saliniradius amylolyticus TaxID=2183582 RepID=UPI0013A55B7D|nr:alginate export family protein [Saliniradius amylolyticus]
MHQLLHRNIDSEHRQGSYKELKFGLAYQYPDSRFLSHTSLRWNQRDSDDNPVKDRFLGLERGYLAYTDEQGRPLIQVGREYYEDDRGFVFHDGIDGIHVNQYWQTSWGQWHWRTIIGQQWHWTPNWLEVTSGQDSQLAYTGLKLVQDNREWQIYGLHRESEQQRISVGLRSSGNLASTTSYYWLEAVLQSGRDRQSRTVFAWGFDFGLVQPVTPRLFAIGGYAVGSGGEDDEQQRTFEQSGLNINTGWLGEGGAKLKYYGEILKPQLSNIRIATLGGRYQLHRKATAELLWHKYRSYTGAADSPDIGEAWDMIINYEPFDGLKLEFNLARYQPARTGAAQHLAYTELRYHF